MFPYCQVYFDFCSVQSSHSVVSDSLRPHESQHSRPPYPSQTPGVHSRLTSIESVMPSNHLILCRPLLLLPPIPPRIRLGRCCLLPFKWMTRRINKNLEVKILIKQFRLPTGMNSVPWLQALFTPNCSRKGREGNGTPLQYSCLENPMDGGAWWAAVHGVSKSRTWLSNFTFTFHFHALEKEMATHSSVLAWRIPGTGVLVGCHLWGRTESDMTEVT